MIKELLIDDINQREKLWPAIELLVHNKYEQLLDATWKAGDLATTTSKACEMYEEQSADDIITFLVDEFEARCHETPRIIGLINNLGSTTIDEWLAVTFIKMAVERMYKEAGSAHCFIATKAEELVCILSILAPRNHFIGIDS